jgi:hypothetical protein
MMTYVSGPSTLALVALLSVVTSASLRAQIGSTDGSLAVVSSRKLPSTTLPKGTIPHSRTASVSKHRHTEHGQPVWLSKADADSKALEQQALENLKRTGAGVNSESFGVQVFLSQKPSAAVWEWLSQVP